MRGLRQEHSARVVIAGHAFVQNVRREPYELAVEETGEAAVGSRLRRARPGDLTPSPWSRLQHARTDQTQHGQRFMAGVSPPRPSTANATKP